MLLINCAEDCVYQKDGCCTLNSPTSVGISNITNCCYYKSKSDSASPKKSSEKKHIENRKK